jgi:hypothetical protein
MMHARNERVDTKNIFHQDESLIEPKTAESRA